MATLIKRKGKKKLEDIRSIQTPSEKARGEKAFVPKKFLRPGEDFIPMAEARRRGFRTEQERQTAAIERLKARTPEAQTQREVTAGVERGPPPEREINALRQAWRNIVAFNRKYLTVEGATGQEVLEIPAVPIGPTPTATNLISSFEAGGRQLGQTGQAISAADDLAAQASKVRSPSMTAGERVVINRTVSAHQAVSTKTGGTRLVGRGVQTAQKVKFVDKAQQVGTNRATQVEKLFKTFPEKAKVVEKFASNPQTIGLTGKVLIGAGVSIGAVSLTLNVLGTYPYAGFIKEESLQTLSFATRTALQNEDVEGAEAALALQEEFLNTERTILQQVPHSNTYTELQDFYKAARLKTEVDRKALETLRAKLAAGETETTDVERLERDITEQQKRAF